ncbi:MAG: hypothetical protein JO358_18595 [Alphaproteobacteria bacterium]|nr:hypothetical protein [Alphaproteobacteria bacterium]
MIELIPEPRSLDALHATDPVKREGADRVGFTHGFGISYADLKSICTPARRGTIAPAASSKQDTVALTVVLLETPRQGRQPSNRRARREFLNDQGEVSPRTRLGEAGQEIGRLLMPFYRVVHIITD